VSFSFVIALQKSENRREKGKEFIKRLCGAYNLASAVHKYDVVLLHH
jgi:hypothetical protein